MDNPFETINSRLSNLERLVLEALQEIRFSQVPKEEKPVNADSAADILGVARQTVYQNIDKIPHKKHFGKLYFFPSQLLAYLKESSNNKKG